MIVSRYTFDRGQINLLITALKVLRAKNAKSRFSDEEDQINDLIFLLINGEDETDVS